MQRLDSSVDGTAVIADHEHGGRKTLLFLLFIRIFLICICGVCLSWVVAVRTVADGKKAVRNFRGYLVGKYLGMFRIENPFCSNLVKAETVLHRFASEDGQFIVLAGCRMRYGYFFVPAGQVCRKIIGRNRNRAVLEKQGNLLRRQDRG